jgi:hypothetical protein
MITARELAEWVNSLPPDTQLAIDDGGLILVEIGNGNDCYVEIGGIPRMTASQLAERCARARKRSARKKRLENAE